MAPPCRQQRAPALVGQERGGEADTDMLWRILKSVTNRGGRAPCSRPTALRHHRLRG